MRRDPLKISRRRRVALSTLRNQRRNPGAVIHQARMRRDRTIVQYSVKWSRRLTPPLSTWVTWYRRTATRTGQAGRFLSQWRARWVWPRRIRAPLYPSSVITASVNTCPSRRLPTWASHRISWTQRAPAPWVYRGLQCTPSHQDSIRTPCSVQKCHKSPLHGTPPACIQYLQLVRDSEVRIHQRYL